MSEEQIKSTEELNQTPVETIETNPAKFDATVEIHARLGVDKQAIVHIGVGKTDFTIDQLNENATVFMDSLKSMKPASIKGQYIKSIFISTTMSPSIAVENIYN